MNEGSYLSLGNIINVIKNVSNNNNAMQREVFCTLFGMNNINPTTINNYCIGIRAIGIEYKKIYSDLYEKYKEDEYVYIDIMLSLLSILDDKIYARDEYSLQTINENVKLKQVVRELCTIAVLDENVGEEFVNNLKTLKTYEAMIELLNYAILINNQPLYNRDVVIKINKKELDEFLKVKLYWGERYINSLLLLARKNNMYACAELGSMEFDGLVSGERNYKACFNYYLKAAGKDHPKGCWMVANLMLSGRVKCKFDMAWEYLNKSIELGSISGYNTLGLCYLRGTNPENKVDLEKAKYYFEIACNLGYIYSFNNLGKMCEDEGNIEEAIKYYKISADMGESWALNKIGEYYRKNGDLSTAYIYYSKSIEAPISERVAYPYFNLAKYYFENGYEPLNIKPNKELASKYYKMFENGRKKE